MCVCVCVCVGGASCSRTPVDTRGLNPEPFGWEHPNPCTAPGYSLGLESSSEVLLGEIVCGRK